MILPRIIPCLLLKNNGLVKTIKFKNPKYIGDPINAVKIFNELEVDELIFLDINATKNSCEPNFELIKDIASECFIPFCYGGGVRSISDMQKLFKLGVEKISLNSAAYNNPDLIKQASELFGSQSIVVSIDVKKDFWGDPKVHVNNGLKNTGINPIVYAKQMEQSGAGELLINNIDCDGTYKGYDLNLLKNVNVNVNIPTIALGGAGSLKDFKDAVTISNVSAVSAGSMFVYQNKDMGVLINYPTRKELEVLFKKHEK